MQKIIINADDFGINKVVTDEIERMIEMGAISSTTIMANGDCLDEVKRFAPLHPEISFGVHLCMSEFSSITKSPIFYKYGITDEQGVFIKFAIFNLSQYTEELKSAIKEELKAQVNIIRDLGIPISHADSHHHFHTIFQLRTVVLEVLMEFGITKIRIGTSVEPLYLIRQKLHKSHVGGRSQASTSVSTDTSRRPLYSRVIKGVNMVIDRIRLNLYYKKSFKTTDSFYAYNAFYKRCVRPNINLCVELMCHPGHPGAVYREEMEVVKQKAVLKDKTVKMISYNEL